MPPLFNDSEIRQLLEDISADENLGGEGGGEADPRRVSVILGEIPSDLRRVSVIQVEKRCKARGGWLDTATITSYALSLLQVYDYAYSFVQISWLSTESFLLSLSWSPCRVSFLIHLFREGSME